MIINADCFTTLKDLPDNSIDLVITSPPYSDICNYGKQISVKKSTDYVDWLLPLFKDIYRILKPTGSFILNINDKCDGGYRSTFIYELIYKNSQVTKLKLYDTYIWHKKSGIPNGGPKRFRNTTEFIFHFSKSKEMKFYMDRVLEEPTNGTKERIQYEFKNDGQGTIIDGERITGKVQLNNELVRPDNVFRFKTAGGARDNTIKHPAPFHKELPLYFINLLTDENDIVLDPFSGIATTGMACKELNREYIGIELNESYAEFSKKRLDGELEKYVIKQYDENNNLCGTYKNRSEASKATGLNEFDIMRCYTRNRITVGGYTWKKELE